jgi:hypothetical protein
MRKIATLLFLTLFAAGAFGQAFSGVSWVNWNNEPDYPDITGYADNPYENPVVVVNQTPPGLDLGNITMDVPTFEMAWGLLGDSMAVAHLTSNGVAGDLFDLGSETPSFGAAWKAIHDGANLYILLKYWDLNAQADAGSLSFEVMAQPTSPVRHEPSFIAASDSAEAAVVAYQNMAYCRIVELGGGKAVFKDGAVSEYSATVGLDKVEQDFRGYWAANWGSNEHGLLALAQAPHFWDDTDGVIRAIMVMSFDGALGYPADPTNLEGDYMAVEVGDTIAFDIKSNSLVGGSENDNKVEYFWASDKNQGYAANYYSGHLILKAAEGPAATPAFSGVSWVNWNNEPDYEGVTGYADNPYDNPEVTILKAPASWTPVSDVAGFDLTWSILGDSMAVSNLTSNGVAGDLFDLGSEAPSFGAAWKAVHDEANFYVLLKYWDLNGQADDGSLSFEIMAQPTSPVRHEYSFEAASDSAEAAVLAYQNMAYCRIVELGGGKAVFKDGAVSEYSATVGYDKVEQDFRGYWAANWGSNEHGLLALAQSAHFWDNTDGVIRAVMVMSFDGALGYPVDPTNLEGDYNAIQVGETFAFDVKSNSLVGGAENDNKVEYFWASDKNQGYAANYYSGHLTLSDEEIVISSIRERQANSLKVYIHEDFLNIRGVEVTDVEIYSITGAKVKSARDVSGQLNVSDINDGIYIVKLKGIPNGYKVVK